MLNILTISHPKICIHGIMYQILQIQTTQADY